jgi:ABC-type sulfate/molybdate transport systems ATPase subunit
MPLLPLRLRRSRNSSDGANPVASAAAFVRVGRKKLPALRIECLATKMIGPIGLHISTRECVALMGPSGAGKSLLLRAIVDLDPCTGSLAIGARERRDMPASQWRKLVALVPAESGWWGDRVGDHFPATHNATELIGKLGLAGSLEWDVARLSTGERQRLALARALCRKPQALLLDEPTASLDDHARGLVEDLIRACCGDDMAVLLVTHDRLQAERMAKRVLRMSDGKIEQLSENVS